MFWDQVHPTTVVHAALSERAAAFIEQEYEFLLDNGGHPARGRRFAGPSADKGKQPHMTPITDSSHGSRSSVSTMMQMDITICFISVACRSRKASYV